MADVRTLLIVDSNPQNRSTLMDYLCGSFRILEATTSQEAQDFLQSQPVHIVILDFRSPFSPEGRLLRSIHRGKYGDIPVIISLDSADMESKILAMDHGAADYIARPYSRPLVCRRIHNVLADQENSHWHLEKTEQDRRINEMQYLMDIDQMTGLMSQCAFLRQVPQVISENNHTHYYMVYLDIANFKVINELFNMETGNIVLKTAASYFNTVTGKTGLACHLSDDSFALLLPEIMLDMDLILQGLDAMMHSLALYRNIIFSAGVYPIDNIYLDPAMMLDRAHQAMSNARNCKQQRYVLYDKSMSNMLATERFVAREMEPALQEKQLYVKFQPVYQIAGQIDRAAPVAAEALLRWKNPERGIISPGCFIPIFERNGFIGRVDRYAWEQACHFLSRQQDWGLKVKPVSINISHVNFYDTNFVDYLLRLIRKYDLQPWMLWLELTEKAYLESPANLPKIMRRLKSCGFHIILDDFGSSHTGLELLQQLSIDMVKIDVRQLYKTGDSQRTDIILESLIQLAHRLKIRIIAEGVETPAMAAALQKMGCDTMQGFYYSKPLSSDGYIELLSQEN